MSIRSARKASAATRPTFEKIPTKQRFDDEIIEKTPKKRAKREKKSIVVVELPIPVVIAEPIRRAEDVIHVVVADPEPPKAVIVLENRLHRLSFEVALLAVGLACLYFGNFKQQHTPSEMSRFAIPYRVRILNRIRKLADQLVTLALTEMELNNGGH